MATKTTKKKWTLDKPVLVDREKFEKTIGRLLKADPTPKAAVKASMKQKRKMVIEPTK